MSTVAPAARVAPTSSATSAAANTSAANTSAANPGGTNAAGDGTADAFAALLDGLTAATAAPAAAQDSSTALAAEPATEPALPGELAATLAAVPLPDAALAAAVQPSQPAAVQAGLLPGLPAALAGPAGKAVADAGPARSDAGAAGPTTVSLAASGPAKPQNEAGLLPAAANTAPASGPAAAAASAPMFGEIASRLRAEAARTDSTSSDTARLPEAAPLSLAAPASPVDASARAPASATVHQAALASQPQDPAFAGDLSAEVRFMVDAGMQKAELRMNPAELGPIHIQLSVTAQTADISFSAAHSATRDGIADALPALREMLASQGMSLGQAGVAGQDGRQQQQQAEAGQQQARHTTAQAGEGRGGSGAINVSGTMTVRATRGMLDLYA